MTTKLHVDSLIFDMDGTLWDAVDSYVKIWNTSLAEFGINNRNVTRDELLSLMGSYLDDILATLVPDAAQRPLLLQRVMDNETSMMPLLGGKLYPAVKKLIPALAAQYKLFMVSNCGATGLENFVDYNGLRPYFTDLLSHGSTGCSKADNIRTLINRYNLERPAYIGDTRSDALSSRDAGVPFIWAKYGFGNVDNPDAVIASFSQLPEVIEPLNNKR